MAIQLPAAGVAAIMDALRVRAVSNEPNANEAASIYLAYLDYLSAMGGTFDAPEPAEPEVEEGGGAA